MALDVPEADMKIQKGFQCKSCSSFLSHPVDVCPVCGDQFYWRIVPTAPVNEPQRDAFVASMINLTEGRVTPEFLTHGGHIWLPYRFWGSDPSGVALLEFNWIDDLEVFQHDSQKTAKREAEAKAKQEPAPWDTIPKMEAPDFSQYTPETTVAASQSQERPAPRAAAQPLAPVAATEKAPSTPQPARANPASPSFLQQLRGDLFVPMMIFLFLILLSISYVVLRYHKNRMTPLAPPRTHLEAIDERNLLS